MSAAKTKFKTQPDVMLQVKKGVNMPSLYSHHNDRKTKEKLEKKKIKEKAKADLERQRQLEERDRKNTTALKPSMPLSHLLAPPPGTTAMRPVSEIKETPLEAAFNSAKSGNITKLERVISETPSSSEFWSVNGSRLLFVAAEFGRVEVVLYCLSMKMNMEERDTLGRTPLYVAVLHAHMELATELTERGADIHARTNEGKSCWEMAQEISVSLAGALKQSRANYLMRKKEEKEDSVRPFQSEGLRFEGEEKPEAFSEAQRAWETQYGAKARQERLLSAQAAITPNEYFRWGDNCINVNDQAASIPIPDDFDEDDVALLIAPTIQPSFMRSADDVSVYGGQPAEYANAVVDEGKGKLSESSFYSELRKSRFIQIKQMPAAHPKPIGVATGIRDAMPLEIDPFEGEKLDGCDVQGEGLIRRCLSFLSRAAAQYVIATLYPLPSITKLHHFLSVFGQIVGEMFGLLDQQRGPFQDYEVYKEGHKLGADIQAMMSTLSSLLQRALSESGSDNFPPSLLRDLRFHTQTLITALWGLFRLVDGKGETDRNFKAQIQEIAQLTRSVVRSWDGGVVSDDDPLLPLIHTEVILLIQMCFQGICSCRESADQERVVSEMSAIYEGIQILTDPALSVDYRGEALGVAKSLASLSSLTVLLAPTKSLVAFGSISLKNQLAIYDRALTTLLQNYQRYETSLPESFKNSLWTIYGLIVELRAAVSHVLSPQRDGRAPSLPVTLFRMGDVVEGACTFLIAFLSECGLSLHKSLQEIVTSSIQLLHIFATASRIFSASIGCDLKLSDAHNGFVALFLSLLPSPLSSAMRFVCHSLLQIQREREERERLKQQAALSSQYLAQTSSQYNPQTSSSSYPTNPLRSQYNHQMSSQYVSQPSRQYNPQTSSQYNPQTSAYPLTSSSYSSQRNPQYSAQESQSIPQTSGQKVSQSSSLYAPQTTPQFTQQTSSYYSSQTSSQYN